MLLEDLVHDGGWHHSSCLKDSHWAGKGDKSCKPRNTQACLTPLKPTEWHFTSSSAACTELQSWSVIPLSDLVISHQLLVSSSLVNPSLTMANRWVPWEAAVAPESRCWWHGEEQEKGGDDSSFNHTSDTRPACRWGSVRRETNETLKPANFFHKDFYLRPWKDLQTVCLKTNVIIQQSDQGMNNSD